MKLYYPDSRVTARQHLFSVRVVQLWNRLPEQVVSGGSVRAFISRPNSIHVSFSMYYVNLNIFTRFNSTCVLGFWCRVSGIFCSLRLPVSSTLLFHSMFH